MASEATKDRLVLLGTVVRAHGVTGELSVRTDDLSLAEEFQLQDRLLVETGANQRSDREVRSARVTAKGVILRLEGVSDRNGAELLRGAKLYQRRSMLKSVGEGEYLTGDLIGLEARTPDGKALGRVLAIEGAGEVQNLEIGSGRPGDRDAVQVPFAETFIDEVRLDEGVVILTPPEELETDAAAADAPEGK